MDTPNPGQSHMTPFLLTDFFHPLLSFFAADNVYFPSKEVKLNLPINEESESLFSKMPLAQFQVLQMESNQLARDYIYSLEDNSLLRINITSGEIFMRTDYKPLNGSVKYVVTAFPREQPENELLPVTHLTLEIVPQSLEDYCAELENVCFWSSAQYSIAESHGEYRSRESFEPVLIGALSSRAARYLCHVTLDYSIMSGSSHFILKQNRLYSRKPLDHDELNGLNPKAGELHTRISCTAKLFNKELKKFSRAFGIKLLDRNDNGPKLQESDSKFDFFMDQPYFQAVSSVTGYRFLGIQDLAGDGVGLYRLDPAQTIVCRLSGSSLGAGLLNPGMMNAPKTRNQTPCTERKFSIAS